MNEKEYGGNTGRSQGGLGTTKPIRRSLDLPKNKNKNEYYSEEESIMNEDYINNLKKAGAIAKQIKNYAREIIKKDMPLLEIANQIDSKIKELGAKPAFPVNLSIDDIAAHYTPTYNDDKIAKGLLKVDIGISIDGAIADTAFSIDLENNEENQQLIDAAEAALKAGLETIDVDVELREIGKSIQEQIESKGFSPIRNLCGHSLGLYEIHSGITIPNYDNGNEQILIPGAYAIEPFTTTGTGIIYEARESNIYRLLQRKAIRDSLAREILDHIEKEYKTLPFASRWIIKKFGTRASLSLKLMEKQGILKHYKQLIERSNEKVAQAENTIIITGKGKIITT